MSSKRFMGRGEEAIDYITKPLPKDKKEEFKKLVKFLKDNNINFTYRVNKGAIDIQPPNANDRNKWRRYYAYKQELEDAGEISPSKLKKSLKRKLNRNKPKLNGSKEGMSDNNEEKSLKEWKSEERFRNTMDKLGIMDYNNADQEIFDSLSRQKEKLNEEMAGGFSGPSTRMEEGRNIDIMTGEDNWFVKDEKSGEVLEKYPKGKFSSAEEVRDHYMGASKGGDKAQRNEGDDPDYNPPEEKDERGESSTISKEYEPENKTNQEMRIDESKREEFSELMYDAKKEVGDTLSEDAREIYQNLQNSKNGAITVGRSERAQKALDELKKEGLAYFDQYKDDPNRYAVVDSEDDGMRMHELFHPLQESNDKHYYEHTPEGTDKRDQAGNSKDERCPEGWEEVKSTYGKLSESKEEVTLDMLEEELGREVTAREYKQLQEFWTADQPTSDAHEGPARQNEGDSRLERGPDELRKGDWVQIEEGENPYNGMKGKVLEIREGDKIAVRLFEANGKEIVTETSSIKELDRIREGEEKRLGEEQISKIEEETGYKLNEKEYEALKGMDKYVKGDGFDNSACINDLEGEEDIDDPAAVCRSAEIAHTGEAGPTKQERQVRGDVNPDKARAAAHNKRTRSGKTLEEDENLREVVKNAIKESLTDKEGNDVDVEPEKEREDMKDWLEDELSQVQESNKNVESAVEEIVSRLDERRFREDVPPDKYRTMRHNKKRRLYTEIKQTIQEIFQNADEGFRKKIMEAFGVNE